MAKASICIVIDDNMFSIHTEKFKIINSLKNVDEQTESDEIYENLDEFPIIIILYVILKNSAGLTNYY